MEWQPIETAPEGVPILVWVPEAHRGFGSAEVVVIYRDHDDIQYWTNGGANAGDDVYFERTPTHWMPIPPEPITDTIHPWPQMSEGMGRAPAEGATPPPPR